jgi:CheY-like chemotaxis protein
MNQRMIIRHKDTSNTQFRRSAPRLHAYDNSPQPKQFFDVLNDSANSRHHMVKAVIGLAKRAAMGNYGILLIGAEPAYRAIMGALLSPIGRTLTCVSGVAEATEAVGRTRFAIILLDIDQKGISGDAAVAMIRARGGWAVKCPIIAFTNARPEGGEAHFLRDGMDGYLAKPFDRADVHRRRGCPCRRGPPAPSCEAGRPA